MPTLNKILIVDDEAHVRRYIAMLVKSTLGAVEIVEASGGGEGLARFAEHRPDLVLLDINMVDANGLETLGHLRRSDPGARVVMLTSVSVRRAVEEALAAGASGYLLKDTPFEEMGADLQRVVERLFAGGPAGPAEEHAP